MIFKSIVVVAVILLLLVCAVCIRAVRILSQKLIYKEETIKELHNVIDDYKYELLTRPERIVEVPAKASLTTLAPIQPCKVCLARLTNLAEQQAQGVQQLHGLAQGVGRGNGGGSDQYSYLSDLQNGFHR